MEMGRATEAPSSCSEARAMASCVDSIRARSIGMQTPQLWGQRPLIEAEDSPEQAPACAYDAHINDSSAQLDSRKAFEMKLPTNPVLSTEPSAVKVTSIVPVEDVTAAGVDVPEKLPSSGADVVVPP